MSRLDTVRQLHAQNYTQREIAQAIGLKSVKSVRRLFVQAGIPLRQRVVYTPEMVTEIKRLSGEEGWPPEEIAATLGLKYVSVLRHVVPGAGVEWRDTASWCARTHNQLFRELRRGIRQGKDAA